MMPSATDHQERKKSQRTPAAPVWAWAIVVSISLSLPSVFLLAAADDVANGPRVPIRILDAFLIVNCVWIVSLCSAMAWAILRPIARLRAAISNTGAGDVMLLPPRPWLGIFRHVAEIRELAALPHSLPTALRHQSVESRQSLSTMRSVLDAVPHPIYMKDLERRYVIVNRAALRELDRSEVEVLGKTDELVFGRPPSQAVLDAEKRVLKEGRSQSFLEERPSAHATRLLSITKAPWRDVSGEVAGFIAIYTDVTEQRDVQRKLRHLEADLMRSARLHAVATMASGWAHELNQPLAAVANYVAATRRRLMHQGHSGEVIEYLEAALEQTARAGTVITRLRDFIGTGERELRNISLRSVIEEGVAQALTTGPANQARVAVTITGPDILMLMDRAQIVQVVQNICRNAAEATADRVDARIDISISQPSAGHAAIEIRDNGPGITSGEPEHVFDLFHSTKAGGLGVGLALCRTIVEAHGGRLTASNLPEGGAAFLIELTLR